MENLSEKLLLKAEKEIFFLKTEIEKIEKEIKNEKARTKELIEIEVYEAAKAKAEAEAESYAYVAYAKAEAEFEAAKAEADAEFEAAKTVWDKYAKDFWDKLEAAW